MSRKRLALMVAVLAVALVLGVADTALAGGSDIGRNVGTEVGAWARGLLLAVAGLVGLPALMRRDVSGGLVIVLLVILIGGFVYAGDHVATVIRDMWTTVAGGSGSGDGS